MGSANGYLQETQPASVSRLSPSWGSPPARWCRSGHEEPTSMPFTEGDGLDKAEAVAEPEGFADTFVFLYRQIHDQLRDEVSGLSKRALSWVPGPDTSSISTLVVHLLGSETEVLQSVRGLPSDRDRSSEFQRVWRTPRNS